MRIFLLPLVAASVLFAGCNAGGGGSADVDNIDEAPVFDQFAYAMGFRGGENALSQDSTFNVDAFEDGFREGVSGDSMRNAAYARGLQMGMQFRMDTTLQLNRDVFLAAFRSGFDEDSNLISEERAQELQRIVQDTLQIRELRARAATDSVARERLAEIQRNAVEGETFLQEVSQRDGIQTSPKGVFYTVDLEGEGDSPTIEDAVHFEYVGMLPDGTEFDRSPSGQPVLLPVNGFIDGVTEALLDMKPGEKRTLYVPAELAYGIQGMPARGEEGGIPPNSPLVFEITLDRVATEGETAELFEQQRQFQQQFQGQAP